MPIVEAVGTAGGSGAQGQGDKRTKEMDEAMAATINQVLAQGIVDPAKILEAKQKARLALKAKWKEADDKAAAIAKQAAEKQFEGKTIPSDLKK